MQPTGLLPFRLIIKYTLFIILMIIYFVYILNIDYLNLSKEYYITIALPLVFILCFFTFLYDCISEYKTPFLIIFTIVAFVRYVFMSILLINSSYYDGVSGVYPAQNSMILAGYLMCWELIADCIFIRYLSRKHLEKKYGFESKNDFNIDSNVLIYLSIFFITLILIIIFPIARKGISFFWILNPAQNDEIGSYLMLFIRECFNISKYFLFFAIVILLYKNKYFNFMKNKFVSYFIIISISVLIIGIRIGTNRKKILADTLAMLLIMFKLFPKYKKLTIIALSLLGLILIYITTFFRKFTNSGADFITSFFDISRVQPYFLGQYNVSMAIEAKMYFGNSIDLKTYIFGLLRPLLGVGQLVKTIDFVMVEDIFHKRISLGLTGFRHDQILPMIGQGYILFGFAFSPLLSLISVWLGIKCDELYQKGNKLEFQFLSVYLASYLAQGMILNITILLNNISFIVIPFAIFYSFGNFTRIRLKRVAAKSL